MTVTRRKFLSRSAAGIGALGLTGVVPSGWVPAAFARNEIMPKNGPRVVVIGGVGAVLQRRNIFACKIRRLRW